MKTAASKLREWRLNPVQFVREVFSAEPDAWQCLVLMAFVTNPRLAMKACKGPGKSTLLAWLCWNFLLTRPHPKVVATSITGDNLKDGLWSEMSKWQQKSPLLVAAFTWVAERITNNEHPETWFMSARTWGKGSDSSQQANTLAGIHADYVLFVLDEAGGIPDAVMAAAEGGLSTGKEAKIVIAGNPTHLEGPLYRACTRERALWWVIEITGDPDDPLRSPRISKEWARAQIEKYGRDNPWVLVNVFGQFPPTASNALLGIEDVTAATRVKLHESAWVSSPKVVGVDPAHFGDDRSVLVMRQGLVMFKPNVWRNLDGPQLAGQVSLTLLSQKPDAVFIDMTGVGASCYDHLKLLGFKVIGIHFGQKSGTPRFALKRDEMWGRMAEWVRGGGSIPDDNELISELVAPTYKFLPDGRMKLESKADMKARGLVSPDKADALALTFALHVVKRLTDSPRAPGTTNNVRRDYDPLQRRA